MGMDEPRINYFAEPRTTYKQEREEFGTQYAFIAPTWRDELYHVNDHSRTRLFLANHLITKDGVNQGRRNTTVLFYFQELLKCCRTPGLTVIIDNGAFEGETCSDVELAQLQISLAGESTPAGFDAERIAFIARDEPGSSKSTEMSLQSISSLQSRYYCTSGGDRKKFLTFAVPQIDSMQPLVATRIEQYAKAIEVLSKEADGICFSILACPHVMKSESQTVAKWSRIQTLMELQSAYPGLLKKVYDTKYVHFLGLFNAPGEITALAKLAPGLMPNSFDSAAAFKTDGAFSASPQAMMCCAKVNIDAIIGHEQITNWSVVLDNHWEITQETFIANSIVHNSRSGIGGWRASSLKR